MIELLAILFIPIAILAGVVALKASAQSRQHLNLVAYRLGFPRELKSDEVERVLVGFSGLLLPWWKRWLAVPFVSLETHASPRGITHYVVAPAAWSSTIENILQSSVPTVRFEPVDTPKADVEKAIEYRLSSHQRTLNVDAASMAAGLLANLQPLQRDEAIVVQWIVTPHPPVAPAKQPVTKQNQSVIPFLYPFDNDDVAALKQKQARPLLLAVGRIGVRGGSKGASIERLRRVEATWHAARAPGVHLTRRMLTGTRIARSIAIRKVPGSAWPATLNAQELVGFVGWPVGVVGMPGLSLGGSRQIPVSPSVSRTGTVLADSTFPGDSRPMALDVQGRLRHLHVLGPTGTGKSTLLVQMVLQDMEAGRGVVLLDPKGDLVTSILERVPDHRRGDVIVLDPADVSRPVGLNPLQTAQGMSAEVVVENLVGLFKSLYSYSWGPRLDDILRAALLTLAGAQGTTLCEVPLILTNPSYRRKLVGQLDDPIGLESFWGWYEGLSDAERQVAVGPVLNKVRAFTMRPSVRSIIGQSNPSLHLSDVLKEGKILLCSLASGLLGDEAASLLGALIVAELWHATTARSGLRPEDRKPVMAYLDEWQHFVHLPTPMASVLAEARGLGLGMTLAHQHLDQLSQEAKHAVLSNARSRVLFQLPAADARVMARELGTILSADDLQGLDAYEVVCQLFANGKTQAPATGRTRSLEVPSTSPITIRAWSRERYGVAREEVERAIRARQGGPKSGPIGRRELGGGAS